MTFKAVIVIYVLCLFSGYLWIISGRTGSDRRFECRQKCKFV